MLRILSRILSRVQLRGEDASRVLRIHSIGQNVQHAVVTKATIVKAGMASSQGACFDTLLSMHSYGIGKHEG
jgi:hypothetical protein